MPELELCIAAAAKYPVGPLRFVPPASLPSVSSCMSALTKSASFWLLNSLVRTVLPVRTCSHVSQRQKESNRKQIAKVVPLILILQKQIKAFNFTENILAVFASSQHQSSDIWLTLKSVASIYEPGATAYTPHF